MKDLDDILNNVTEAVDTIENIMATYPELEADIEYSAIPLKLKARNLLVHIEVLRVSDNLSIFSYDIVLLKDPEDQFSVFVMGYETLCTTKEQFDEFEIAVANGIDSLPTLESFFTAQDLTVDGIVSDFIAKFNNITKNVFGITNAIP